MKGLLIAGRAYRSGVTVGEVIAEEDEQVLLLLSGEASSLWRSQSNDADAASRRR